jgi:hypothetical protein
MTVTDDDILRVVQTLTWADGNIIQNVYNCKISGGGGPYDDQDVADDMADWMDTIYDGLAAAMSSELNTGEAVTYLFDPVGSDWDEVAGDVPTFTPAAGGEYLPTGVAAMARANSTDPDVQARKFFGGFTEDVAIDGGWTTSALALLVAAGLDWITAFTGTATGATFTPGVWSPTTTTFFAFVAHLIVNGIANYQRRRRPGVGV